MKSDKDVFSKIKEIDKAILFFTDSNYFLPFDSEIKKIIVEGLRDEKRRLKKAMILEHMWD